MRTELETDHLNGEITALLGQLHGDGRRLVNDKLKRLAREVRAAHPLPRLAGAGRNWTEAARMLHGPPLLLVSSVASADVKLTYTAKDNPAQMPRPPLKAEAESTSRR